MFSLFSGTEAGWAFYEFRIFFSQLEFAQKISKYVKFGTIAEKFQQEVSAHLISWQTKKKVFKVEDYEDMKLLLIPA